MFRIAYRTSVLLYALCLIRLGGNHDEAIQYLESIPQDFPRSPEAEAARAKIAQLSVR